MQPPNGANQRLESFIRPTRPSVSDNGCITILPFANAWRSVKSRQAANSMLTCSRRPSKLLQSMKENSNRACFTIAMEGEAPW